MLLFTLLSSVFSFQWDQSKSQLVQVGDDGQSATHVEVYDGYSLTTETVREGRTTVFSISKNFFLLFFYFKVSFYLVKVKVEI